MMALPARETALELFYSYTQSPSLRLHGLAVEQVMRCYARHYGEDEALWGLTGLLHDFDYEKYPSPDGHPKIGVEILIQKGYPDIMLDAILGHASYTGIERKTLLAKTLFACDELTGFLFAVTYVRPSRSIHDVKVKSVTKKLKTPSFAAKVNRDDITTGIAELGIDRAEHIQFVINALQEKADELGLAGDRTT